MPDPKLSRAAIEAKTWPPERWPTPAEWIPWFKSLGPDDAELVAGWILEDAQQAYRCKREGHDQFMRQVRASHDG